MDFLSVSQIARRLHVSRSTVLNLISKNSIQPAAIQRQQVNLFPDAVFPIFTNIRVYDFDEICRYLPQKKRVAA